MHRVDSATQPEMKGLTKGLLPKKRICSLSAAKMNRLSGLKKTKHSLKKNNGTQSCLKFYILSVLDNIQTYKTCEELGKWETVFYFFN